MGTSRARVSFSDLGRGEAGQWSEGEGTVTLNLSALPYWTILGDILSTVFCHSRGVGRGEACGGADLGGLSGRRMNSDTWHASQAFCSLPSVSRGGPEQCQVPERHLSVPDVVAHPRSCLQPAATGQTGPGQGKAGTLGSMTMEPRSSNSL